MEGADANVAVLLGAGASADAGIPGKVSMSDAVIDRMRDSDHTRLLRFICHTLEAESAARATPDPIDVERLFAAVQWPTVRMPVKHQLVE